MTREERVQEYFRVASAWQGHSRMSTGNAINLLSQVLEHTPTSEVLHRRASDLLENIIRGRYRIEREKIRRG